MKAGGEDGSPETPLLLASGAWNFKKVGGTQVQDGPESAADRGPCARGFQTRLTGWVLAADYRMLDCILIVSPLEGELEQTHCLLCKHSMP